MTRRRKVLVAVGVAVGVIVGTPLALLFVPQITGPWLPAGATRLHIATEPPNLNMGCASALLAPVRVAAAGDELVLTSVQLGKVVKVVWPGGFGAWRADGRDIVANAWGTVIAMDGDVLDELGGGEDTNQAFHICPFGIRPRAERVGAAPTGPPPGGSPVLTSDGGRSWSPAVGLASD